MINQVMQGDCLEVMKDIPDGSVDCIITDPPYGISFQSSWKTDKTKWFPKITNDESPFIDWIKPAFEKLKGGGRLICFYRYDVQEEFMNEIKSAGFKVKSQIVWDKVIHGMGDLRGAFAPQHELILYATKGRYTFKGKRPKSVYRFTRVNATSLIHPAEKPLELIEKIINDITQPGETILDLFAGSGTTAIAARNTGRNFILIEKEQEYINIINERLYPSVIPLNNNLISGSAA